LGKIGFGYGSEWHLLWYLGRHRDELSSRVAKVTSADQVNWLDLPKRIKNGQLLDAEWRGLDFMTDDVILARWREFWPAGVGVQNWDAVAKLRVEGHDEWLLVEAKGHCGEITSNCAAKPEGGLSKISQALESTKSGLGVDPVKD
jgi:hypothetical protein